jgi:hypothetical protein
MLMERSLTLFIIFLSLMAFGFVGFPKCANFKLLNHMAVIQLWAKGGLPVIIKSTVKKDLG